MSLRDKIGFSHQEKSEVVEPPKASTEFSDYLLSLLKKKRNYKKTDTFLTRASAISQCPRAVLLKMLEGAEEEQDGKSTLILETGTAVHEILQNAVKASPIAISSEEQLKWPDYLEGHYDYLVDWKGEKTLLEFKTAGLDNFLGVIYRGKPIKKNVEQAHVYMHLLGVKKALIIYINRNYGIPSTLLEYMSEKGYKAADKLRYNETLQIMAEFEVDFDDTILATIVERLDKQKQNFMDKKLPKYKKLPECDYCGIKEMCHKLKENGK